MDVVNSYQRQCFTYDQLDRLTHAWTGQNSEGCTGSAGAGTYNESYSYDSYGRLSAKTNTGTLTYDATQEHAVDTTGVGGVYHYDANGNMDQSKKTPSSTQYNFSYDSENRLVGVSGGSLAASFVYDGDGRRVKAAIAGVVGGTTTYFVGGYYEVSGSVIKKYYYAGGQRVAMRQNGVLYFLLGDHLGSTSVSYKADGTQYITQRYKPWGELRPNGLNALLTKFTYTGQYSHVDDFGLMYYNARWYDPALGRFAQADTIVPGMWNPGAFDRYAYVLNNPLRWVDPSGHGANSPASWSETEGADLVCDGKHKPECVDKTKLSDSGKDAYETYLKLWNTSADEGGWWWEDDALTGDGSFSVEDFITLTTAIELDDAWKNYDYVQWWIKSLFGSYYRNGDLGTTSADWLNWVFAQSGPTTRTEPADFRRKVNIDRMISKARQMMRTIRDNPYSWGKGNYIYDPTMPTAPGSYNPNCPKGCLDYIFSFIKAGCPSLAILGSCNADSDFSFFLNQFDSNYWNGITDSCELRALYLGEERTSQIWESCTFP